MAKEPFCLAFCQFKECENLKHDQCKKDGRCPYNQKLIAYWEKTGIWKGE